MGSSKDPSWPTEIVDDRRPIVADREEAPLVPDKSEEDLLFLNIRENMNQGKTITWMHHTSSHLVERFSIDSIDKMDTDTVLYLDQFFNLELPPAPYNKRTIVGSFNDKKKTWKGQALKRKKVFFDGQYESIHLYPMGALYMFSTDLAQAAVRVARDAQSYLLLGAFEGHEDHDTSLMAFLSMKNTSQPIKLIMLKKDGEIWRHRVKRKNLDGGRYGKMNGKEFHCC